MKIKVDVLIPNSADRRSTIKGPIDIPPRLSGPNLNSSQEGVKRNTLGISRWSLIVNWIEGSLAGKTIESNPTKSEKDNKRERERHHILLGKELINVIKSSAIAAATLHVEDARMGVIKNINTQENLILGSMKRSQLDLPATY